jgi:pimeloyl-ACP methyl ester carboxylesterase
MSEKNHRYMIFISSVLLLSMVLAACGGAKEAPLTVPAEAQAGDLLGLESCTYEADDVEYAADCGTLVVPENRGDPNSRLIALPVIRVRATGSSLKEPLFWFNGGPNTNVTYSPEAARLNDGLIDERDFVMVGYRGIDGSVVLECPEIVGALKSSESMLSDPVLDNIKEGVAQCAGRLQAEGVDLDGYNIMEIIDDMEAARVALGYERINLLSQSFGSRVAMIYAWRYPDSLYRVVMYAALPPGRGAFREPEKVDEQIEYYASLCAQDAECSTRSEDLAKTIRNVSHNMPKRWLFLPINEGSVMGCNAAGLSNINGNLAAPPLLDIWMAAGEGDFSGLAMLSVLCNMLLPGGFNWGPTYSLLASVDFDPSLDYRAEMNSPDSIIGAPFSYLLGHTTPGWPVNPIPDEYRQVQPSDVEMLMVNGPLDLTAPPEYPTEELLPHSSNGQQVILKDFGHTTDFWALQPEARVHLLTSFYDTGVADDSLYTYQPVNFQVGLGFPEMAKLLVAIVVLVPLLLVALVWFVVQRVRRRRANQEAG